MSGLVWMRLGVPALISRHMPVCLHRHVVVNGCALYVPVSVECMRPADISGLVWTRLGQPRGCLLGVRRADGPTINFLGFKDKVRARINVMADIS